MGAHGDVKLLLTHPLIQCLLLTASMFVYYCSPHSKTTLATTGVMARGRIVRARRKRLEFVTSCIERQLYNAAPTYEDYANLNTLYGRISGVLVALIVRERRQFVGDG